MRTVIFSAALTSAFFLIAASASAATYLVTNTGANVGNCTLVPCATVQYAVEQHRDSPEPDDVIDVGPGTFVGNVAADDPDDDGLTIRGTLGGGTRQTTLRGEGAGVSGVGSAVLIGGCGDQGKVKLRDANVDTIGADSFVAALEVDGGSHLLNVHAANQPGSDAGAVVYVCQRGSKIIRSEIVAGDTDSGIFVLDWLTLASSTVTAEAAPAVINFSLFGSRTRVRRSSLSLPESGSGAPVIATYGTLIVDSSLLTGGDAGAAMEVGSKWRVNNSTIDAGTAGVVDPGAPSLLLEPFAGGPFADVTVDSSILVDGLQAPDGDGLATCTNSDLPSTQQGGNFVIDCATGGSTSNTTTDPSELFVGGIPYDWELPPDSPAIDTGGPGPPPSGFVTLDLLGNPRRAAGTTATCPTGIRDKGAYERVGPPCVLDPPTITNGANPSPGTTLVSHPGQWSGQRPSYLRQWLRCDADGDNCTVARDYGPRKGYTPRSGDVGFTFRVQVIATNNAGDSDPALSDQTGVVTSG